MMVCMIRISILSLSKRRKEIDTMLASVTLWSMAMKAFKPVMIVGGIFVAVIFAAIIFCLILKAVRHE